MVLENYFAAELQPPARNTVGSGIAGKHVTTIAIECETPKTGSWIPGCEGGGRTVNVLIWSPQPLMIEHIKRFRLKLKRKSLTYPEVLEHGKVGCTQRLASLGVPA